MRHVVFDTETTGRDPQDGDRIVEIGCVELRNLVPTGRALHAYVNPGDKVIPDEVVRVHGLTNAFLRDKPAFGAIVDELMAFFAGDGEDTLIVAHNAEFDRKFLNAELVRIGREPAPQSRFLDTLALARETFPGANNKLDALAKRFGLDALGFDLEARRGAGGHGALVDAKILAEVFLGLNGGRQRTLEIGGQTIRSVAGVAPTVRYPSRRARPVPLAPRAAADDLAAHAAFLTALPAPSIWSKLAPADDEAG